jgi:hypothetical protein
VFKNAKPFFEIAYFSTWHFRNKFKNNFKPNDRQSLFENPTNP